MSSDRLDLAIAAALVIACIAIYAQTLSFDFVGYDDEAHITLNPITKRGLTGGALLPALQITVAANWHPLTQLSHMLDIELYGLDAGGHHATNLLLHALASVLVFVLLRRATGSRWRSAFVAGLFAVHPLHVEAVAWVSQRKTLLSTVFGLGSLVAYVEYARRGSSWRLSVCAGLLTLGLLAKAMLVTLPVLFLLLDFWPLRRATRLRDAIGLAREKLWLVLPVAVMVGVTILTQGSMDAIAPTGAGWLFGAYLPNAMLGYVWYLAKMVWPSGLAVHYPHPWLAFAGGVPPSPGELLGSAALLVALVLLVVSFTRRRPWLGFGLAWYAIALLPVIGIVQVGTQAVADRYAYLTLIGPFVALSWEAGALSDRLRLPRALTLVAATLILVAYGTAAHHQVGYWRDGRTLHARALEVSPRDVSMLFNMGNVELGDGNFEQAKARYREALAIHPANSPAQLNLAELLLEHGGPDDLVESIALYRSVLVARPRNARARKGLRSALQEAVDARDG